MKRLVFSAYTLGCKVNQYDTDAMLARVKTLGFRVCNFNDFCADVYVINTCTVTHVSDKKSRQIIRRARKASPLAFIAVCGCMPQGKPEAMKTAVDAGADFVFDAREPDAFLESLQEMIARNGANTSDFFAEPIAQSNEILRTRAFVKIQDGCNRFCAYCIIPFVRGALKSRPMTDILLEVETLTSLDFSEVVLTGIQASSYGEDMNDIYCNFPELIRRISNHHAKPKRLRLSSFDPWAVNENFLDAAANSSILCDHFHLSLQSGCDTTLQKMNRRYTTAVYAKAAESLRKLYPNAALTTDIIVGFPGETDEDFAESLAFVEKMNFARLHVFEYSKREGTAAASFPHQISDTVKSTRSKQMRQLADKLSSQFLTSQIGKILPVLSEQPDGENFWRGHATNYCPVKIPSESNLENQIKEVKITSCHGNTLTGQIINI